MIESGDWTQMQGDLDDMIGDNRISITLRRGESSLAAQDVRLVRVGGRASQVSGSGTSAARAAVIVYGFASLDIQRKDRFTHNGSLYEVTFIRPSRLVGTVAEAEVVE